MVGVHRLGMSSRYAFVILQRKGIPRQVLHPGSLAFSSDSSDRNGKPATPPQEKDASVPKEALGGEVKPARSKLMTVLAGMRVDTTANLRSADSARETSYTDSKYQQTMTRSRKESNNQPGDGSMTVKIPSHMMDAVDMVAEAFSPKIDPKQTKSELVGILLKHEEKVESRKRSPGELGHLLAGMKIDRTKKATEPGMQQTRTDSQMDHSFEMAQMPMRAMMEPFSDREESSEQRKQRLESDRRAKRSRVTQPAHERIDLFGEAPLGLFSNKPGLMSNKPVTLLKTWDELQQEELLKMQQQPPKNAFEEMSLWTKQGKMWRFPINNEQDFFKEQDVDFTEHIFLEHLIADFPRKGPIKQFMDLVIYGISRNPYITVAEKKDHINWFRKYFKEKRIVLVELMGEELCTFTEEAMGFTVPSSPSLEDKPAAADTLSL